MNALALRTVPRAGLRAVRARPIAARTYATAEKETTTPIAKGAKKDPELYILLAIMSGAFGLAGWYFGTKPTSSSSEVKVSMRQGSMPWENDDASADSKYKYHPGGDKSRQKDAPSALNTVIIPNVNLPKRLHDKYNKWGKDGY